MTFRRYLGLALVAGAICLGLSPDLRAQASRILWLADGLGNKITSTLVGSSRGVDVYLKNPADGSSVAYISEDHNSGTVTANTPRFVAVDDPASANYHTSTGSGNDETQIKSGSGIVRLIWVSNTNAAPRYLRCHDATAAGNTPGSTAILVGSAIPGDASGRGFVVPIGREGLGFTTGFTCDLATGAADSNTTNVAADEIKWNILFK